MVILPAIDLRNGRCVNLVQGRAEDETIFSDQPVEMAKRWEAEGATYLHLVDLDGAFHGASANLQIVEEIVEAGKRAFRAPASSAPSLKRCSAA